MTAPRKGPRRADGTAGPTVPIAIRFTPAELAALDTARGEETRSDFVRRRALLPTQRDGTPAEE